MKRTALGLIAAVILCLAATTCSKTETYKTSIALTVVSDLVVGMEVDAIEVDYEKPSLGKAATQKLKLLIGDAFPVTMEPAVSTSGAEVPMKIRVKAMRNRAPAVSQTLTVFLIQDEQAELTVSLNRSCLAIGSTCEAAGQTCVDGFCVGVPLRVATVRMGGTDGSVTPGADAALPPGPKLGNGTACEAANSCISGNCVNGACCSVSSCGSCTRCDVNGAGTCAPVTTGQPDPVKMCVDQGAKSCANNGLCDGAGGCQKHACTCDGFVMPNLPASGLPNPASYTAGDGFIVDNVTKLEWEHPFSGKSFTQSDAVKHCADKGAGWRLPTLVELFSAALPETPIEPPLWTSSLAGKPSNAFHVRNGIYIGTSSVGSAYKVRCVR